MRRTIHFVCDATLGPEAYADRVAFMCSDVDYFHIRVPNGTAYDLEKWIEALRCRQVPEKRIVLHDRLDVAIAHGVGGVQLGERSLSVEQAKRIAPNMRIGRSIHTDDSAYIAACGQPDWFLFGHVYATASKQGQAGRGIAMLRNVVQRSDRPVVAIGGMDVHNVGEVRTTGVGGVALLSRLYASDALQVVRQIRTILDEE
ncbi:MAG: thiamine phosphate synthase [Bacilli bacterium]